MQKISFPLFKTSLPNDYLSNSFGDGGQTGRLGKFLDLEILESGFSVLKGVRLYAGDGPAITLEKTRTSASDV